MTFDLLMKSWAFKPIRNCPGRYVLAPSEFGGPPERLLGPGFGTREVRPKAARDTVVVTAFGDGGGLISYRRADGTHVHTLNTQEGFERKLRELGVAFPDAETGDKKASHGPLDDAARGGSG
jgi:hypothetical protein